MEKSGPSAAAVVRCASSAVHAAHVPAASTSPVLAAPADAARLLAPEASGYAVPVVADSPQTLTVLSVVLHSWRCSF